MALHYLLDGYNIIKQIPSLAKLPWEDGRASLIRVIETENPQGSVNNEVTIFFDGRSGRIDTPGTLKVKVTFTGDHSADDRIKKAVTDAENKRSYVVVTDDREVQYYVRSLGANVLKVKEFLSQVKSHQDKTYAGEKSASRDPAKVISKDLEQSINSEMEQIWLGKKKKDS